MPIESKSRYRLRIENCIGTIIDVYEAVSVSFGNNEIQQQFESLKDAVGNLDMDLVREGDVLMVEKATNILLGEFKSVFELGQFGPVYAWDVN